MLLKESVERFEKKVLIKSFSNSTEFMLRNENRFKSTPQRIFPDRYIHNIYLDTYNYTFAKMGLEGESIRKKLRLRWYSQNLTPLNLIPPSQIYFEKKVKYNDFSFKESEPFISLTHATTLKSFLKNLRIGRNNPFLIPSLLNSYKREYFSIGSDIRLTLDTEVSFSRPDWINQQKSLSPFNAILEIKYPESAQDMVQPILQAFETRKISKYNLGLEFTNESLY